MQPAGRVYETPGLGFHIFRLFHAINCIYGILPNFMVSI